MPSELRAKRFCSPQPTFGYYSPAQMRAWAIEAIRTWSGFQLTPGRRTATVQRPAPPVLLLCNPKTTGTSPWLRVVGLGLPHRPAGEVWNDSMRLHGDACCQRRNSAPHQLLVLRPWPKRRLGRVAIGFAIGAAVVIASAVSRPYDIKTALRSRLPAALASSLPRCLRGRGVALRSWLLEQLRGGGRASPTPRGNSCYLGQRPVAGWSGNCSRQAFCALMAAALSDGSLRAIAKGDGHFWTAYRRETRFLA